LLSVTLLLVVEHFWEGKFPYRVAYAATGASLFGDETRAKHLTGQLLRFFGTV
jgi:hypothetical protein